MIVSVLLPELEGWTTIQCLPVFSLTNLEGNYQEKVLMSSHELKQLVVTG